VLCLEPCLGEISIAQKVAATNAQQPSAATSALRAFASRAVGLLIHQSGDDSGDFTEKASSVAITTHYAQYRVICVTFLCIMTFVLLYWRVWYVWYCDDGMRGATELMIKNEIVGFDGMYDEQKARSSEEFLRFKAAPSQQSSSLWNEIDEATRTDKQTIMGTSLLEIGRWAKVDLTNVNARSLCSLKHWSYFSLAPHILLLFALTASFYALYTIFGTLNP